MKIYWTKKSAQDLEFFRKNNQKIVERIKLLIDDIKINPYQGLGKPEPLKYNLTGCWSRRITGSNRLVYRVNLEGDVEILQCRYHY
mgnify:CR=1 FL=1